MTSTDTDILNDLVSALRGGGCFATVELGGGEFEAVVPRATVLFERRDVFGSEPHPAGRQVRLQARVLIRTRTEKPSEGVSRLADLAQTAAEAILADPSRGQRCCNLPIGRATEIMQARPPRDARYPERKTSLDVRRPEWEICLTVRCHYELPEPGSFATSARLDGEDLFSSGPCEFLPGSWPRQTLRRGLPGLDGEIVLDLGLRSRTILQRGRLQADSAEDLQALLEAIEAKNDGAPHTLLDPHGRTFDRIVVEAVEPQSPIRRGCCFGCDYEIRYRQLP